MLCVSSETKAGKAFQEMEDELEEFLLASDQAFIDKMRRSRKAHIAGNVRPFKERIKKAPSRADALKLLESIVPDVPPLEEDKMPAAKG